MVGQLGQGAGRGRRSILRTSEGGGLNGEVLEGDVTGGEEEISKGRGAA